MRYLWLLMCLAGTLLVLSCHPGIQIPTNGIYHGAYCEFGPTQDDVAISNINDFEALAGKKLAIVGFGNFWGENYFPKDQLKVISDYGAQPLVYWEPWGQPYEKFTEQPAYYLDTIIGGRYDAYVKNWADSAKKWGKSMLVSFAPEMNGEEYPWIGDFNGSDVMNEFGDPAKPDGPERYVAATQHVIDLVKGQGAKNITWVFQPNSVNTLDDWNRIQNYYPGDGYAEWLGMSAYGAKSEDYDWISFDSVVEPGYAQLESISTAKPMMLAQWGVGEVPDEGNKWAWLDTAFTQIKGKYTRLKAAVYWHDLWDEDGTINDLRINSSPEAESVYAAGVSDDFWLARP